MFAFCVVLPFIELGIPSGHDFEFHLNSWIEVVEHWKQGSFYPHWAAMAHFGFGEARFIFYPPFSWTLGALLGTFLPWKLVPAAFIWIVLALAGCSMYFLARQWLSAANAIFASALYAATPYILVIVYWRSAFAELMAAIYPPLLLSIILRSGQRGARIIVPLTLLMAAGWLTNLPSAVMMNYSLGLLALTLALWRRSYRLLLYAGISCVLGATLAGFYLVPAFHQQNWVNIGQVLGPGVRPVDNFLFTNTEDADHNLFNFLISIVAVVQIALTVAALVLWRRRGRSQAWWLVLAWAVFSALLMVKPLLPAWTYLPELRFVQFPWRWLLCLNLPFALAIAFATRRWWMRALFCLLSLAVFLGVWYRVQAPWWDNAGDIQEMLDNQFDGTGNDGVDEYVPIAADPYDIDRNAPLATYEGGGNAQINTQQWFAEKRFLLVNASAPGRLVLKLFTYPSWKVHVNGHAVQTGTTPHTGQMTVPITAGVNKIQIDFVEGRDRRLGILLSVCTLVALILLLVLFRRSAIARSNRQSEPSESHLPLPAS